MSDTAPYFQRNRATLYLGDVLDVLREMPSESVHTCVTSPPYWSLRDYGCDGQIGLEPTPEAYVAKMVEVFREVRRVLRQDATLWLNLGDSYSQGGGAQVLQTKNASHGLEGMRAQTPGMASKQLLGIPWRVALALQADGWWLRSDIIWAKPNPMPESVTDRPTKSHEYLFLLAKSATYYYDAEAIAEPSQTAGESRVSVATSGSYISAVQNGRVPSGNGVPGRLMIRGETRNRRDVWTIPTAAFSEAHFATFSPDLVKPCVLAGCPEGGTVLDPFAGSGTTLLVARQLGRVGVGIELNPEYADIAARRLAQEVLDL